MNKYITRYNGNQKIYYHKIRINNFVSDVTIPLSNFVNKNLYFIKPHDNITRILLIIGDKDIFFQSEGLKQPFISGFPIFQDSNVNLKLSFKKTIRKQIIKLGFINFNPDSLLNYVYYRQNLSKIKYFLNYFYNIYVLFPKFQIQPTLVTNQFFSNYILEKFIGKTKPEELQTSKLIIKKENFIDIYIKCQIKQ